MESKSLKISGIILFILLISLIVGAAYILLDTDKQAPLPAQTKSMSAPVSADNFDTRSSSPQASRETPPIAEKMTEPAMPGTEKPEPRQVPRQLTEEQKEENRREMARMAEALPDNMWVPKDMEAGFSPDRGEKLRKSIELSDKIRKGNASPLEQKEFYSFKLKETTDKIELIRYIAERTEALSARSGKKYLTRSDIDTGAERIEELEQLAKEYEQRLSEIDTDAK